MSRVASLDKKAADPIGTGIISTARQSWLDLFIWHHRVTTVLDGEKTKCEWVAPEPLQNPITLFRKLSARDWLFFVVGFLAWTADAFDFHALSIQTTKLSRYYQTSNTVITSTITLTLLLRSLGAAIFGIAGDKIGRKWPMVLNMIILGLLQIATIYCETLGQLLGVRSLFGLFMGGIYGNATAMALENCPMAARGLMSGILQQGYSFGYVLAACANLGVGGAPESFKKVFWIGAGFCIAVGLIRTLFPESKQFLVAKAAGHRSLSPKEFWRQTRHMMATEYKICLYCILLMTWFNFYSHSSQDSYTTFMEKSKGLINSAASRASIWMKVGACVGGTIMGYISQFFGRRRTMIAASLISTLMIPGWILPHSEQVLSFTGFIMQFFVQGAWGVIPIYLNELAPAAYRSTFSGITYQVGNMISSPSTQIVNALAEHFTVDDTGGTQVPAYGPVMGVATAFIALGIAGTLAIGPERMGRSFEEDDSLLTIATVEKKAISSPEPGVV